MRLHPIHKTWRAHLGVDYGAPTGTPVRTIADGFLSAAGPDGSFAVGSDGVTWTSAGKLFVDY